MAMVVDNQKQQHQMVVVEMQQSPSPSPLLPPLPPSPQAYKYYCRVCKKGFMCGRALGGHMRAHGISNDGLGAGDALDDDSGAGDPWDMGSPSGGTKRMYALRTNPNRLKICRVCQNCGKEFMSWKLFLEHGKCNSDEVDNADGSLHSSPPSEVDGEEDTALAAGWSKGKRSRRSKMMVVGTVSLSPLPLLSLSSEEEDLANCLVMLSSSRADIVDTDQESCASASKEDDRRPPLPQPISFMAPETERAKVPSPVVAQPVSTAPRGMFECKACKKVFTSHQALGGHRASHKKVKGCFATKLENDLNESLHPVATAAPHDNANAATNVHANTSEDAKTSVAKANTDGKTNAGTSSDASAAAATLAMAIVPVDNPSAPATVSPFKKKAKLHECSICHRVFTSGQALGGHKRCHWLTSSTMDPIGPVTKLQSFAQDQVNAICHQLTVRPVLDTSEPALDLNIPANPTPQVAAARRAELSGSPLRLDVPASVYLQSWTAHSNANHRNKAATSSHNDVTGDVAEDEADSTNVKRAKLSDLKDINMVGESSSWLQVGIGSSPGKSAQE